jgi:hypothetical protein
MISFLEFAANNKTIEPIYKQMKYGKIFCDTKVVGVKIMKNILFKYGDRVISRRIDANDKKEKYFQLMNSIANKME